LTDLRLKKSEKKYIQFIIKDEDDNRLDLTGCEATLQIQKYGESTLRVNSSLNITDATEGECRYYYQGNLPVGYYKGEIEVTTEAGLTLITKTFTLEVIADLPET